MSERILSKSFDKHVAVRWMTAVRDWMRVARTRRSCSSPNTRWPQKPHDRLADAQAVAERITNYLANVQERLRAAELARATAQTRRRLSLAIAVLMLCIAAGAILAAGRFRQQREEQSQLVEVNQRLANDNNVKRVAAEQAHQAAQAKSRELSDQLRVSRITRLAALSRSLAQQRPVQSLLLALEAVETPGTHDDRVMPLAHEALLSASIDVGGWPVESGKPVGAIAVSSDSRWLVTGLRDGEIGLWDIRRGERPTSCVRLAGHLDDVAALSISPDSRWLASASYDGTAKLWDLHAQNPSSTSRTVLRTSPNRLTSVTIGPQGRWFVAGCEDGSARLIDLHKENSSSPIVLPGHPWYVRSAVVSPNGSWLVSRGINQAYLWHLAAENIPNSSIPIDGCIVDTIAFSPDSDRFVVGGRPGKAMLWDLTGETARVIQELPDFDGHVADLAISPNGRWLVTADLDTARVWNFDHASPIGGTAPLTGTPRGDHESGYQRGQQVVGYRK